MTPPFPNPLPRPPGELEQLERGLGAAERLADHQRRQQHRHRLFLYRSGFLFFLLAGVLALLMRLQLAVPSNTFLSQETYNQIFTMHGTVMMFLFAVPAVEAMGILLLPADARRARSAVSASGRLCILGLSDWRTGFLRHVVLRHGALRRLVHVSAADELAVLARRGRRLLAPWHRLHRNFSDCRGDRDHRRRAANARAWHVARQDCRCLRGRC